MTLQYYVSQPRDFTKQRMIEVHFYINILALEKGTRPYELEDLLETLCISIGCRNTYIMEAYTNIKTAGKKPSARELMLLNKYLDVPLRKISKITRHSHTTLYKSLRAYIAQGEPDLQPQFEEEITNELRTFNKGLEKMFSFISYTVPTHEIIYGGVNYD